MNKNKQIITDTTHQLACDYLTKQFDSHSWWPTAQPAVAKQEFKLMHETPEALNVWCERWLDSGQIRKLEKEIQKQT